MHGNYESVVAALHAVFASEVPRREPLMRLAHLHLEKGDHQRTVCYASAALQIPGGIAADECPIAYGHGPHEILYVSLWWLGRKAESKEHFDRALSLCPRRIKYLLDYWFYYELPKVSIVLPTLGRPDGLQRCLASIGQLAYPHELIETIVLDGHETVPQKVNLGLQRSTGQIICYAANDMEFEPESLFLAAVECVANRGLVAFNSGPLSHDHGNICEHFVIHRDLIRDIGGRIFDLDFHHVGVDNLLWAQATLLKRASRNELAIVRHHHFSRTAAPKDDVYAKGWSRVAEDRALLAIKLQGLGLQPNRATS